MFFEQMSFMIADIQTKIENFIKIGVVAELNHEECKVRVDFGGEENSVWVGFLTPSTQSWRPLHLGEQVCVLSPNGDVNAGLVIGCIHSKQNPPVSTSPDLIVEKFGGVTIILEKSGQLKIEGARLKIENQGSNLLGLILESLTSLANSKVGGEPLLNGSAEVPANVEKIEVFK